MNQEHDPLAWDIWRKSMIEESGNDPDGWVGVSKNLVESGSILASTYSAALAIMLRNVCNGGPETDRPRTPEENAIVRRGLQTSSVSLMLYGFAIECLLKATYLNCGGILYKNGRYKKPALLKHSHNLLEIAESLGCISLFTEPQRDVLDLLSAHNEKGRYPTHTNYENYGTQPPNADGFARCYQLWDVNKSALVFDILDVLYKELGEEIPSAANALLEQGRIERSAYGLNEASGIAD